VFVSDFALGRTIPRSVAHRPRPFPVRRTGLFYRRAAGPGQERRWRNFGSERRAVFAMQALPRFCICERLQSSEQHEDDDDKTPEKKFATTNKPRRLRPAGHFCGVILLVD
jgi:hypothetical protein